MSTEPERRSTRTEGGAVICNRCNSVLTFNFIERPPQPHICRKRSTSMTTDLRIEFVRDSHTPEQFDGWWQVWVGTSRVGKVRKDDDPPHRSRPWGWYREGERCRAGYGTRLDAARALVRGGSR